MADAKVSELSSVSTVGGSDLIYIIQNGNSRKASVSNVFASVSNVVFNGNISLGSSPQLLTSPGIISTSMPVTFLECDITGGILNIPQGAPGQVKIIILSSTAGGSYRINTSNMAVSSNVTFDNAGDTATLIYYSGWYVIGGTANVTY